MATRELPFVNVYGTRDISSAKTVDEALQLAGLDWKVNSSAIFDETGKEITGFRANIRDDTGDTLGIVSNKYCIIQNAEAFDFVNDLPMEGDFKFEKAGIFREGRASWVMGSLPKVNILGDDVTNNLVFVNSHDGSSGVKVMMTPVRLICSNMLNLAMRQAERSWAVKHTRHLFSRLDEARYTLNLANKYMDALTNEADYLANISVTDAQIEAILDLMFPIDYQNDSKKKIDNIILFKNDFFTCYNASDISQFKGNAWGAINAMADLVDHRDPTRKTNNYYENHWNKLINGHATLDRFYKELRV